MSNVGIISSFVKPQFDIAKRHIELLTGNPDAEIAFRLIHEIRENDGRNLIGTLADVWPQIESGQADGYGVFLVVNEGGQRAANISRVRALFVDADDVPLPSAWHCEPTFLVKRGSGRWHAYWLVGDLALEDFEDAQRRLAARYGTDTNVHDLPRVMRLAGSIHLKDPKSPKAVTLTECEAWCLYGTYSASEVLAGLPIVPVKLAQKRDAAPCVEIDHPRHQARYIAWLEQQVRMGCVAIAGKAGDALTLQTINKGLDFGCSPEIALGIVLEHFNDHCQPPWDADELSIKVSNAAKYRQNAIGCDAFDTRPSSEVIKNLAANAPPPVTSAAKPSPFRLIPESEMDNDPPVEWLIKDVLQRRSTAMMVGESKSYKSFLALDVALAVASGRETFGTMPTRVGPVVYAALEGLPGIKSARRKAWRQARNIEDGQKLPFFTAKAPQVANPGQCQEFIDEVLKVYPNGLELIVLETASKMLAGLDENSSQSVGRLSSFCDGLVEMFGCTVVVVHHKSDKVHAADVRGSSAFVANFDTTIEVKADKKRRMCTVKITKMKDGEESQTPWRFKAREVGTSLVLHPLSEAEHDEAVKGYDPYCPVSVGAALKALGAVGAENGVGTAILASEIIPPDDTQSDDDRMRLLANAEKQLQREARNLLRAYCENEVTGRKRRLKWFLPA